MEYILKIRDLSNEAKELNELKNKAEENSKEIEKEVRLLANNHCEAITSFLSHQWEDVKKLKTNVNCYPRDGIVIQFFPTRFTISIRESGCSTSTLYDYDKFSNQLLSEVKSCPLYTDIKSLRILIQNWDIVKRNIQDSINKVIVNKTADILESDKKKREELELFKSFEI